MGTGRVLTGWGWTDPTNFDGEGFLDWELETILGAGNWRAGLEGTCWFIVCWFITWACWLITWVCWTPEPWDINWGLIAVVWPWAGPKLGIVTGETFLTYLTYLISPTCLELILFIVPTVFTIFCWVTVAVLVWAFGY